ncbi:MAG: sigma-70 family RNA polymerase sigma factor [Myxococcales bacterium]|nr:sigma-70 family RNA polymerase sigma factor [Myxococcales bacterium]MCB9580231.1 sigma-70 family RNA polymerase sigma factor [Polyangiaceae bacterium]
MSTIHDPDAGWRVTSGRQLLDRTLAGGSGAARALITELTPVVQARVARGLMRSAARTRGRDVRQELEDLTQEVFAALFADDARALRSWDPTRGLSLENFVGLVAERQVASILRSGKRSPWIEDPEDDRTLEESLGSIVPERILESRDLLERLLDGVRARLSPRGLDLFYRLCVREEAVETIAEQCKMTPDSIYAWRSRLRRTVRDLAAELAAEGDAASDVTEAPRIPKREKSQ